MDGADDDGRDARREPGTGLPRTPALALCCLAGVLLLAGCFEDRVEERLTLGVSPGSVLTAHYAATLHDVDGLGDPARDRVEELARALEEGRAPWQSALSGLRGARRRGSELRWGEERLEAAEAWVTAADAGEAVPDLFAATDIDAFVEQVGGTTVLSLRPGNASRADRRQRQRLDDFLRNWAEAVAAHCESVARLWDHLEANPERELAVLDVLFEGLDDRSREIVSDLEASMLERFEATQGAVLSVFETPRAEARSAQELSRLVHDPYPLEVVVALTDEEGRAVEATPLEVVGLVPVGSAAWTVPRTSLWDALAELEGTWVTPDPLLAAVRHALSTDADLPFDVDSFAALPRAVRRLPTAQEVRGRIEDRLRPPDLSSIVWSTPAAGSP